jgi:hypothetical protein
VSAHGPSRSTTRRSRALPFCAIVLLIVALPGGAGAANAPVVAVADFYAPTPVGSYEGMVPERFAADDLTAQLAAASAGRLALVPRVQIEQAEAALRWQTEDALRFDRLTALARAVGADELVVGWITMLSVETGGHQTFPPDGGNGSPTGDATIVVQVFSAAQGRIVAETRHWASTTGFVRALLAKGVLHEALRPAVPVLLRTLVERP